MDDLTEYYRERAPEYDAVYAKPERQADLSRLRSALTGLVAGKTVLEVAAGTGFWTAALSTTAQSVVATDLTEETLEVARARSYGPAPVSFHVADAYRLEEVAGDFDLIFAGFFWSHVLRADVERFARELDRRVGPGGSIVLADNRFVDGSNHPITRTSADGDTYQTRRLTDGREYEVLKNFPDEQELRANLEPLTDGFDYTGFTYFWLVSACCR